MLKDLKDRIKYLRDQLKDGLGFKEDYLKNIWALKNDAGTTNPERHHYKFRGIEVDEFTDFVALKIANAIKKSTKATALTLKHGNITDRGMIRLLDAIRKTNAPIKELNIDGFPNVTDDSLKFLPDIIREKGITTCNLGFMGVAPDIRKQINEACSKNITSKIVSQSIEK